MDTNNTQLFKAYISNKLLIYGYGDDGIDIEKYACEMAKEFSAKLKTA